MDKEIINKKMLELSEKLGYEFKNIENLAKAMGSIKKGTRTKKYENDGLATVGDAILKAVLADYYYSKNKNASKGDITNWKSDLENNYTLNNIMDKEGFRQFTYSRDNFYDKSLQGNEAVRSTGHDPYIEAIVGAIYYDGNWNKTRKWIIEFLLPLLEKHKEKKSK